MKWIFLHIFNSLNTFWNNTWAQWVQKSHSLFSWCAGGYCLRSRKTRQETVKKGALNLKETEQSFNTYSCPLLQLYISQHNRRRWTLPAETKQRCFRDEAKATVPDLMGSDFSKVRSELTAKVNAPKKVHQLRSWPQCVFLI